MKRILFFCSLILVISPACAIPGVISPAPIPTFDLNLIPTMIIQTAEALALSATVTNTNVLSETPASTLTLTAAVTDTQTSAPEYGLVDAAMLTPQAAEIILPTDIVPPAADTLIPPTAAHIPVASTPTTTSTPTSTTVKITCAQTNYAFELSVMKLINAERAKAGLSALSYQPQLAEAAHLYSADMACNNYLSHTGRDGSHFIERAGRQGYTFEYGGENLGGGYSTPEEVVKGWMNSPGHKANILDEHYVDMGVGYAYYSQSDYVAYWAAEFGRPK